MTTVAAVEHPLRWLDRAFLTAVLFTFLLAPYVVVGGLSLNGGMLSIMLVMLVAPAATRKSLRQRHLFLFGSFYLAAAFFSAFVGAWYGSPDPLIIKLFVSVVAYIVLGSAVGYYFVLRDVSFDEAFFIVLQIALGIIVFNSFLVIAEFYSPVFKRVVESFLVQGGGIDYKNHLFRFRGLASAGGAALSVFHALGVWLGLKLYKAGRISFPYFIVCMTIVPFSVLFVGRTAIIVIAVAVMLFVLDNLSVRRLSLIALVGIVITGVLYLFARNIDYFLPEQVQQYSVLLFTRGFDGLQEEGTVGSVRNFFVLPDSPAHLLLGIGYFGGPNVLGIGADAGYIKFMLAFGIPLGVAVYAAFLVYVFPLMTRSVARSYVLPIVIMLLIVEVKEPFLYHGYSARLMFVLGGLAMAYRHRHAQHVEAAR